MAGLVPFLMKDVVLLAVSIYLLKQDVVRLLEADPSARVALSGARQLARGPCEGGAGRMALLISAPP